MAELLRRAGGRWALVNTAYEVRPPSSTEQILHPAAYFDADEPKPVRIRAGAVLGSGWERVAAGTWGELQTRELLARAGGGAREAVRGLGRRPLRAVAVAAARRRLPGAVRRRGRADHALALGHAARRGRVREAPARLRDERAGLAHVAVVARRGGAVTLVLAPDERLAERLAAGA